ncbi:Nucleotide-binding protein YvcJ [bioreactor metagenome]|uniref:Nucleotide-binding protein YvcJ n=1 Tax=bioreactor metagenome TaxID=1076179 RepID=A0A644VF62_9ZZZZ|nr:RNase adapter RapZ [Acidaminococcaceae bacterium]
MENSRNLIITGMSGAGKTQVIRALEDLNYFCVDNLPPALIPKFIELCMQAGSKNRQLALVVDSRGGKFFDELVGVLDKLEANSVNYELLFLDASDETLIKRYKESRRRHPLCGKSGLSDAIARERGVLRAVRAKATTVIDTTNTVNSALREKIIDLYGTEGTLPHMSIVVQSFGFKHGMPMDCDMVFDVRFLPNPFYVPELKPLSGNDQAVVTFIESKDVTKEFLKILETLIVFLLPQYVKEGKSQLMIGVGCTGGRHRSVYVANVLRTWIQNEGYVAHVTHRDMLRK